MEITLFVFVMMLNVVIQVWAHGSTLLFLNAHEYIRSNGIHPRVLKELADIIMRPLSIISAIVLGT